MDRCGVPQVMEPRLIARAIFATDASLRAESLEVTLQQAATKSGAKRGDKKRCVAVRRVPGSFSLLRIFRDHVVQFFS